MLTNMSISSLLEETLNERDDLNLFWFDSPKKPEVSLKSCILTIISSLKQAVLNSHSYLETLENSVNSFNLQALLLKLSEKQKQRRQDSEAKMDVETIDSSECNYPEVFIKNLPSRRGKKKGIFQRFIDIPDLKMKSARRSNPNMKPRLFPKKAYYKLKVMRMYKKAAFNICRVSKMRDLEIETRYYGSLECEFPRHTKMFQENIRNHLGGVSMKTMKKENYEKIFKTNWVVAENFRIFINEYFTSEIWSFIQRFGFKCCEGIAHCSDCEEKWEILKVWTIQEFLGEV
jgi:hypothetical protein